MSNVERDVRRFMSVMGQITPDTSIAVRVKKELVEFRAELIQEEVRRELFPALHKLVDNCTIENQAEVLDAIVDSVYVLVGTAIAFGLPFTAAWDEVQRANMAKIHPDGTVKKREDGKVLKPEGWKAPDIWSIVKAAHDEVASNNEDWGKRPVNANYTDFTPH